MFVVLVVVEVVVSEVVEAVAVVDLPSRSRLQEALETAADADEYGQYDDFDGGDQANSSFQRHYR